MTPLLFTGNPPSTPTLEVCCIYSSHTGHEKLEYISNGSVSYCIMCIIDSFCGVSVCLVKLRRLTAWWRLLPHATVTAMLMSSSPLVSSTECTIMNFLSSFLFMEWKCQCSFISTSKISFPQWNCNCVNCITWPIMNITLFPLTTCMCASSF